LRCHSRSRTRCDGTPCYSYNEHRSHCVLAGDTRLPRASVALPMLSAHKPHWCHRRQAEHAAVRGSRQTCAATTWNRTRPANPRRHRCDCWTRGPTAEAPTPSGSMHRDAPAVKARERPRQPFALSFLYEILEVCTPHAGTEKWASFFFQRPDNELLASTPQQAIFQAERQSHAMPGWSKYLAEPSEHPQPSHPNVPPPRGSPTTAYFSL
jgi:hypothetical protein